MVDTINNIKNIDETNKHIINVTDNCIFLQICNKIQIIDKSSKRVEFSYEFQNLHHGFFVSDNLFSVDSYILYACGL